MPQAIVYAVLETETCEEPIFLSEEEIQKFGT